MISAKPNAKNTKITEINEEYIGVSIAAPPREGEANEELGRYMAEVLQAKKKGVYVDKGEKSRNKILVIEECSLEVEQIVERLQS